MGEGEGVSHPSLGKGGHAEARTARPDQDSRHHSPRPTKNNPHSGKLQVSFYGEEGIDAGGLTREWYSILAREMFNQVRALSVSSFLLPACAGSAVGGRGGQRCGLGLLVG